MASSDHYPGAEELLNRYRKGERNFSGWRLERVDLSDAQLDSANFRGALLHGTNLRDAYLGNSHLSGANLSEANLNGANLHHVDLGYANLSGAQLLGAGLGHAHLSYTNLTGATLKQADLRHTYLGDANLRGANLEDANLSGANLRGAHLSGAIFKNTNLNGADLANADLVGARLDGANLRYANLSGADLRDAHANSATTLGDNPLLGVNLGPFCRGNVKHIAPSQVDFRSILLSLTEPRLMELLRRTGMPEVFVIYMIDCARTIHPTESFTMLQSTFISYGGPDEGFARKLNDALEVAGVTTFLFKDDAPPGEKLHRLMRRGVNGHDRTILICSRRSLNRPGLLNELEETLAREARDGGKAYLIPVRLDDYVFDGWSPSNSDLAQAVRDRVVADFREHDQPNKFRSELAKLLAVLVKPMLTPTPSLD